MSSCAELAVELVVELAVELAVEPRVQVFLSVSVCAGWAVGWLDLAGVLGTWVWRMAYGAGGGRLWWERGPAAYVQVLQIVAGARLKFVCVVLPLIYGFTRYTQAVFPFAVARRRSGPTGATHRRPRQPGQDRADLLRRECERLKV